MSVVAANRPHFSPEDAQQLALDLYGLETTAVSLPSDRDQNFHLQTESGPGYVLKIASAAEDQTTLAMQNALMRHLNAHADSFPHLHPTRDGEEIATVVSGDGKQHVVRLLSYLPGKPLAETNPQLPELLSDVGRFLGQMDRALLDFEHPAATRNLHWDLANAPAVIHQRLQYIEDSARRQQVAGSLARFEETAVSHLGQLRRSIIHSDANDHNVLVDPIQRRVTGLIDFGDVVHSATVFELAIACAYVMLNKADPVAAASHTIAGYHEQLPLTEQEIALLFDLIRLRLCQSVAMSAQQQAQEPDNDYLRVSEAPAWALLEQLVTLSPALIHCRFRHACGLSPCPAGEQLSKWLHENKSLIGAVVDVELTPSSVTVLDLSVGSPLLATIRNQISAGQAGSLDPASFTDHIFAAIQANSAEVGIGRYNEARQVYTGHQFREDSGEWRTIHVGLDLFLPAGAPVLAPLDGVVHSYANNTTPLDYGPTIILQHETGDGLTFYTLYGHLSRSSLAALREEQPMAQGEQIATIGDTAVNGGWPPHLHFQIIADLLGHEGEFPGVAPASQRDVWLSLCPDPTSVCGVPTDVLPAPGRSTADITAFRRGHLGHNLSVSYRNPLKIVRGWQQWLYDETGRPYLDVVNNVCHVGHSHPHVVDALARQASVLNTNTRYLHDNLVEYAERLCATLPDPLNVCFFVCSGSEANDLALRLARTHTGQRDVVVVNGAYHGNLTSLIEISPYKHDGPGGSGTPPHVQKVPMPDPYRGPHKRSDLRAGAKYAAHVEAAIERVQAKGRGVAAFIVESLLGCGGQIVLPDGYLQAAFGHVRAAGGVCIVDEVQVGFGRVGSHFWGFETQNVVPDVVTMGKPMGNGHPLAAVVTTPEIAASFANGMEYFNTFGGNPVSCAVGLAVLDVIEQEELQQNALAVGGHLMAGLRELMADHAIIGDVRGRGLFVGVELVVDRQTLEPAARQADYVVERTKDRGILLSTDGPLHNVIKMKPPLVFSKENADFLVATLDQVLAEDGAGIWAEE